MLLCVLILILFIPPFLEAILPWIGSIFISTGSFFDEDKNYNDVNPGRLAKRPSHTSPNRLSSRPIWHEPYRLAPKPNDQYLVINKKLRYFFSHFLYKIEPRHLLLLIFYGRCFWVCVFFSCFFFLITRIDPKRLQQQKIN